MFHRAGLLSSKYFRMRLIISLVLFGCLIFQALAAPAPNTQPTTAGGTSSANTVPVQQPAIVEYGKVYGVAVKDHRSGPPDYSHLVSDKIDGNSQARKRHKNAIKQPHPFIPTHKETTM